MAVNDISQSASFQIKDKHLQGDIIYILNQSAGAEFFFGKNVTSLVQITKNGVPLKIKANNLFFTHTERDEKININEFVGDGDVVVTIFVWESFDNPTIYSQTKSFNVLGVEPEPEPCQEGFVRIDGVCLDPNACYCRPDQLCNNGTCLDNIGKNTVILNKNFIAGAVEGNKPVTNVKLIIDVPVKSDDRIITSNLFTKINATRVGLNFLDLFYTSLVNVSVNGDRITSLNLEQDLFVDGKIKEDTNDITLKRGRNEVIFNLDFGQAGLQYDVYSDIYIKTEKGDKVNVKIINIEEYGTGGVKPIDIGLGLLPIVLGLGAVILLSTGGGRTIIYKGAKAGFNKVKNR